MGWEVRRGGMSGLGGSRAGNCHHADRSVVVILVALRLCLNQHESVLPARLPVCLPHASTDMGSMAVFSTRENRGGCLHVGGS